MNIRYIISSAVSILSFFFFQTAFAFDATYYSDAFEWGRTANGGAFSQSIYSAALCDEELWSYAYVQWWQTGAVVTINDRPNCSKNSESIDLSKSVFELFAPISRWRISDMNVSMIGKNELNFPKKVFENTVFSPLWIILSTKLSNTYFAGDSILIEGKVIDKKEYVMVYLQSEKEKQDYSLLVRVEKNGKFKFPFPLPKLSGKYYFVIASGNSFETTTPESIVLLDRENLTYPEILSWSIAFKPSITYTSTPYIPLPSDTWGSMTITQWKKKLKTSGTTLIVPSTWIDLGEADVTIDGYSLSSPSSLDRSRQYDTLWSGKVLIDRTHEVIGKDKVNIRTKNGSFIVQFRVGLWDRIRSEYYVTYPSGEVREFEFQKKLIAEDGFLIQWSNITLPLSARESWAYKIETVLENGYAHFNVPLFQGNTWSIIAPLSSQQRILSEKVTISKIHAYILSRINMIRTSLGRKSIELDPKLSELAQLKAENMAQYNYVGHWTPEWLDILGFARSLQLDHPKTISENVAWGNVSYMFLQDGLEESGSHRYSMINPNWTKMGIGYSIKNKKAYLVQVFSE